MNNQTVDSVIEELYANNGSNLHQICNKEIIKFGGISQKDYDDFYSRVGIEITKAKESYDPSKGKTFKKYISSVIKFAICKEMSYRNRMKRQTFDEREEVDSEGNIVKIKEYIPDISIDSPISNEDGLTIADTLQSDFDMDDVLFENMKEYQDENVEKYLISLPKLTRQIIEMKMNDISVSEIKEKLSLTDKEYCNHMNIARLNENIALFTKKSNRYEGEYEMDNIIPIDVTDNYRMDKFPLGSLLDDMRDGKINKKHILQREPFQWTERQKNKFLTRVLNGQPIPEIVICEQTIKGKKKSHLIDGLQRLSYSELFRSDGLVIKIDGAEFYDIPYKEYIYDEEGNIILDEEGDALFEEKIFNVIGKKFSDFPKFLKDRFNKFNINVTTYFNCTDDQIAYHIRNYNNQEGMNKSQYEFTGISMSIANQIKDISKNNSFFKDNYGKYTGKNKIKGDIDKIVVESIMAINFIDNWKKEVKDSFSFVNDNATEDMFISFKDTLNRLCDVVNKEVKNMFTTTNSSVWFAVFDKFKTLNIPDIKFKDFIIYVNNSLENLKVDGEAFVEIYKSKNTRDKKIVIGKVNGLISLMYDFFCVNKINTEEKYNDIETFISDNVGINKGEVHENIEIYKEDLNGSDELRGLKFTCIRDGSRLLDMQNDISLIAMVAYSYKIGQELDNWLTEYAKKNNTYFIDQKKNFLHMKQDFDNYLNKEQRKTA